MGLASGAGLMLSCPASDILGGRGSVGSVESEVEGSRTRGKCMYRSSGTGDETAILPMNAIEQIATSTNLIPILILILQSVLSHRVRIAFCLTEMILVLRKCLDLHVYHCIRSMEPLAQR